MMQASLECKNRVGLSDEKIYIQTEYTSLDGIKYPMKVDLKSMLFLIGYKKLDYDKDTIKTIKNVLYKLIDNKMDGTLTSCCKCGEYVDEHFTCHNKSCKKRTYPRLCYKDCKEFIHGGCK